MIVRQTLFLLSIVIALTACSGGGSTGDSSGTAENTNAAVSCDGSCANASLFLTISDVKTIIAQAIQEAQAHNINATIAVVDRVGNVLAVYRMGDASTREVLLATSLDNNNEAIVDSGLEGIRLPTTGLPFQLDHQAAISKALTGAYLSSEGNAFSSRTASQIVQENFNPGEINQPAGPLFGVQFSQLSCSDFTVDGDVVGVGPRRSPLGLSADPGGLPLYKEGTVVGGIGVIADGLYSIDKLISDQDRSVDEMIAYAATFSYAPPLDRRGDRITVDGKTFRFSDVEFSDLLSSPSNATDFDAVAVEVGSLIPVTGYTDGVMKAGLAFGEPASGVRADAGLYPGQDAFVFVDAFNVNRYPPIAGTVIGGDELSSNEVQVLLQESLRVANRSRAQIRRPLGSQARVTISVVDTEGEIVGIARTRDAPIFGADVSIQKARTAAFFSSINAATVIQSLPDAIYINTEDSGVTLRDAISMGSYVSNAQSFIGPTALSDGVAFSDRAGGNLSRPFFPDGLSGTDPGPFSKALGSWSVFSTGFQLDAIMNGVLKHVLYVATEAVVPDQTDNCTGLSFNADTLGFSVVVNSPRIANGVQIFPGSVPIYRGNTLIGGIGVSGDGIDQDDMISFLGLHNAGVQLDGAINNAPAAIRADTIAPKGTRLRFIQCPQAPFLDSNDDNVCDGK